MRNGLTTSSGTHIVIGYASELPNVVSKGISVEPGVDTMISLKLTETARLKPLYGTCVDDIIDPHIQNMYPASFKYSAHSCDAFCFIVNTRRQCNCAVLDMLGGIMLHDYDNMIEDVPRCDDNSPCRGNPEEWYQSCYCSAECRNTIYQVIGCYS